MQYDNRKISRSIFTVSFSIKIKNLKFLFILILFPILFALENTEVDTKYKPVKETPTVIEPNMTIERVFKGDFEPSKFCFS